MPVIYRYTCWCQTRQSIWRTTENWTWLFWSFGTKHLVWGFTSSGMWHRRYEEEGYGPSPRREPVTQLKSPKKRTVNSKMARTSNITTFAKCFQQFNKALIVPVNACWVMIKLEVKTRKNKPEIQPPWKYTGCSTCDDAGSQQRKDLKMEAAFSIETC